MKKIILCIVSLILAAALFGSGFVLGYVSNSDGWFETEEQEQQGGGNEENGEAGDEDEEGEDGEEEEAADGEDSASSPVSYISSVSTMPYAAASGSNGVKKPDTSVLTAEKERIRSSNNYISSGIGYSDAYIEATVRDNVVGSSMALRLITNDGYGALFQVSSSTSTTDYVILLPKFNPFDSLYDMYEVATLDSDGFPMNGDLSDYYYIVSVSNSQFKGMKVPSFVYNLVPIPVSLPDDPVKEGYDFVGWYYGAQDEHGDGTSCVKYDGSPIYADTAMHAHFKIKTFRVEYDSAGGSTVRGEIVDWNTSATAPTPIWTGHKFLGWYLSNGTKYEGQAIKENTVLTARWELKKVTVTFYVDGEEYDSVEVDYGTSFSDLEKLANEIGLHVELFSADDDDFLVGYAVGNVRADAVKMNGMDKVVTTLKNHKWEVVVGVVAGFALLVSIGAACVTVKRKR